MPLFGSKFATKKSPSRKSCLASPHEDLEALVLGQRVVPLRLGDQSLRFENGDWIPENGQSGTVHKSNKKLKQKIVDLEEENNLLRLKYAVILKMLTQTTAESHLQEHQLEKLRQHK